jgi:hypothetical protein
VKRPSSKVSAPTPAQKKAAPKKAAKKPHAAKMASLTASTAAMVKAPPESADVRKVVDESSAVDVAPESSVDMLNDATVDIDSSPLADYITTMDWRRDSRARSLRKKKKPATRRKMSWKRSRRGRSMGR